MSVLFSNHINAAFPQDEAPSLNEIAEDKIRINSTSFASERRCLDVWRRAHIRAAAAINDRPREQVLACDLYLPDEYASFSHREKCLTGMILAWLHRIERSPFKLLPYASSPRRYQIIPSRIDFDLIKSIFGPRCPLFKA